jgi:hypothetical protein
MTMENLIGLTVGMVLSRYGLSYTSLRLIDEPPGRLWGVEIALSETPGPQRMVLQIEPQHGLFSEARNWPREMVEQQRVLKVHDAPNRQF